MKFSINPFLQVSLGFWNFHLEIAEKHFSSGQGILWNDMYKEGWKKDVTWKCQLCSLVYTQNFACQLNI